MSDERGTLMLDELLLDNSDEDDLSQVSMTDELKENVVKRLSVIEKQLHEQLKFYISYSPRFKPEVVYEIAEKLESYDFKILIDKNPNKETQLEEDFQNAIDESTLFILFFNEEFKASELCASELIYAERRNKRMLAVSMDATPWGRWLNFYLGEHLWMKLLADNENQPTTAITTDDFVRDMVERIGQIFTQPPPQNNRFECLTTTDVPSFPKYFQRKNVEDNLLFEFRNISRNPEEGVMVVCGEGGLGKTTMVSQILLDKLNTDFFILECGVKAALWLNCLEWRDSSAFSENQQRAFIDKLLALGKRAASSDPAYSTIQFFEIDDIIAHFRNKLKKGVIFVFDDVMHIKIVECFRRHCHNGPCCIITRRNLEANPLLRRPYCQLPEITDDDLVAMLEVTCDLEGKLTQKQLRSLARRSYGSPMIASLLAARFGDCERFLYDQECETLLSNAFSRNPRQAIRELFEFNITRAEVKEKKLRQLYFAFLMFEQEEPVCVEDLAILWGYEGETFKKGVLRTKGLCRVLERKCLVSRLQDYLSATREDCFTVHQQMYESAFENAKIYFNVNTIEQLRRKIASGACALESEDEEIREGHTLIGIVGETIIQKRRLLLEKIVDKCEPQGLAELCSQKSVKTGGMTFLHFLYNTTWPDNVMMKWNINLGINHSYRLIAKILQRLYHQQISFEKSITDIDATFDCLIIDIFDQEASSAYSVDRQKILRYLNRFRHEYQDCKAEKENVEKFGYHPAITSTIRGYFDDVKHYFSSPSLIDPQTETEIDRATLTCSAIEASARHGHVSIFQYLLEECFDAAKTQTSQLLRAFMLAAANGHVEIVQKLHGENKCDAFSQDEGGMTAIMYAARGGHLPVIEYLFVYSQNPSVLTMQDKNGFTAIIYAARLGHDRTVQALHRMNPEAIKLRTNDGWTALAYASASGYHSITAFLYENYPDALKMHSKQGKLLPIMLAAKNGHLEMVKFMYANYSDAVKERDANGWTPLFHAASNGHIETVDFLYQKYRKAITIPDSNGLTPLMAACKNGHAEVENFCIENRNGSDLNALSKEGITAFQYGAFNGHLSVVKLLAEKDRSVLEVTTKDGRKCSGLSFAVTKGHLDIIQYLYNKNEKSGAKKAINNTEKEEEDENDSFMLLISAVLSGHLEVVTFLAEQHPHALLQRDSEGQTVLMAAAQWGFVEIAEYLYARYQKAVELTDNDETTPLMKAAAKGALPVVEFLYEKYSEAASLLAKDGSTCLMAAAKSGNVKVVEFFFRNAPDTFMSTDYEGISALMVAAMLGHVSVIEFLYQKGRSVFITMKDHKGMTALSYAAKFGRLDACKFLHEQNAELITWQDSDQFLPITHAVVNGHLEVVKFLYEEYQDCAYVRDNDSKVPLMIAAELGQAEIAKFLCDRCEECSVLRDLEDNNAFLLAMKQDHPKVLQCLANRCPSYVAAPDSDGFTFLTHASRLGKLEMAKILYISYPAALNNESNEGMTPLSYAAAGGHLAIVEYFYSQNREAIGRLDKHGNMAVTYAMLNDQMDVVKFLCDNLLLENLAEMMASKASNDTIVTLCRYAERLASAEDWATLLQPASLASEFIEVVVEVKEEAVETPPEQAPTADPLEPPEPVIPTFKKVRRYQNIENNTALFRSLEILHGVTDGDETFSKAFVEREGLQAFAKLLIALREFRQQVMETGPSSPLTYIRIAKAEQYTLTTLGNVAECEAVRSSIVGNADLLSELTTRFQGDIDSGTDPRPWLAGRIFANILLSPQEQISSFDKEAIGKELCNKIQQWNEAKMELGRIAFRSCLSFVPLMTSSESSPAVQLYALWLLCTVSEADSKRYKPILEKEGILKIVEDISKILEPPDNLGNVLAKRLLTL